MNKPTPHVIVSKDGKFITQQVQGVEFIPVFLDKKSAAKAWKLTESDLDHKIVPLTAFDF